MKKKIKILIVLILLIIIISSAVIFCINNSKTELLSIKSESELAKIYDGDYDESNKLPIYICGLPFTAIISGVNGYVVKSRNYYYDDIRTYEDLALETNIITPQTSSTTTTGSVESVKRDYSTTNIQVENVDEADITKTDGNYIYSISDNNVIITDVRNTNEIKIASKIEALDNNVPEDLMLYKDKLVVISTKVTTSSYYSNNNNTMVEVYDITDRTSPSLLKDYELFEPYYTSRCIGNQLYVISSGNLRKENGKVITYYKENSATKNIGLENIKYLKDIETRKQTLISSIDLNDTKNDINVNSYLIDISNAYVSENSIYLLNQKYRSNGGVPPISSIFGPAGILGAFFYEDEDYTSGYFTDIYKFNILNDGKIEYNAKARTQGQTINQYSLDEKDNHLRVALYDNEGTRVVIFNESLKEIGKTDNLAKGEKMYSSRFIGNKVYLVTYKTVDPLFVIDLSNEENPKVLGKLKIPGYSTYLHPYDENHIIGIGMETEEKVNRDSTGRVRSTTATLKGMKMALFDVSDVNSPKQISSVVIGDSRTTSAILTNPKALLFSKEKELIAIPVNNYTEEFKIETDTEEYSTVIDAYKKYNKEYVAEGYFVYKINVEDGFKLKGVITHEKQKQSKYYYYYNNSKLLRGLYIDDNLYTVSESAIKVNKLDTLEQLNELKIK